MLGCGIARALSCPLPLRTLGWQILCTYIYIIHSTLRSRACPQVILHTHADNVHYRQQLLIVFACTIRTQERRHYIRNLTRDVCRKWLGPLTLSCFVTISEGEGLLGVAALSMIPFLELSNNYNYIIMQRKKSRKEMDRSRSRFFFFFLLLLFLFDC